MEAVKETHFEEYKVPADIVVSAPGRFHLTGDHSSFFLDKTLSMAVNMPEYLAVSVRNDFNYNFYFHQQNDRKKAIRDNLKFKKEDRWANFIKGIISAIGNCPGFDFTVYSDYNISSGLGISTAIKVSAALAITTLIGADSSPKAIEEIVKKADTGFLGTETKLADLFTAIYSEANTCILTDYKEKSWKTAPFIFPDYSIVLTDTKVPHVSVWNEQTLFTENNFLLLAELKCQKKGYWIYEESAVEINEILSTVDEDSHHRLEGIIKEHKCVTDAFAGLSDRNFSVFARAVNKSHEVMRDLYTFSCPETDWLVKRVLEMDTASTPRNPTACSRITGKGGGRLIYSIIKTDDIPQYRKKIADYERIFGFHPVLHIVEPVGGVKILEISKK